MMTPLEARLTEEVATLRAENKLLREKVDLLVRRIFPLRLPTFLRRIRACI